MPRDDEKHRHRRRSSRDEDDEDRDQKPKPSRNSTRKDDSSRHPRKHHNHSSDEEEALRRSDRKNRHRGGDKDDETSSSESVGRRRQSKHAHRRHRKREESSDRKKTDRKSDDRKKKKRKRKHIPHEDSSDDEKLGKKSNKRTTSSRLDKSTLCPMGDPVGSAPVTLIDPDKDYFTYHQEFWVYLFREEGVRFNDIKSDEAREAFARFAKMYNNGQLEAPYYGNPPTFPLEVLEESKTTRHEWSFQTTETERKGLEQLQEGVRRLTQYRATGDRDDDKAVQATRIDAGDMARVPGRVSADNASYGRPRTPEERMEEHRGNRRLRESVRTAQEEVTGGAKDFRERQVEKKREQAARMHGAARDKEEGGAGIELSDAAVYGDGDRSFKQALEQERRSKARREEQRNARVEELKNKEQERQANMLKILGLDSIKPGQKIQIAPRNDG